MEITADTTQLKDLELTDVDGQPVKVGSAWANGPAVLVWLRHFGCVFCREQVRDYTARQSELASQGIALRFIGLGTPLMAKDFGETMHVSAPIWVDKGRRSYALLHFKSGWGTIFNPKTLAAGVRALFRGNMQGKTQGKPDQQGGVLVVGGDGRVRYGYASEVAGDHPPVERVLQAARDAAVKGAA